MLPETVDAPPIYRGDGWSWPVEFYSDSALTVPVDLTAYGTVWAAQGRGIGHTVVDFDVDASGAAAGRIVLSLPHGVTTGLVPSSLEYDVQATPPGGDPVTLIRGTVAISGDVTRP